MALWIGLTVVVTALCVLAGLVAAGYWLTRYGLQGPVPHLQKVLDQASSEWKIGEYLIIRTKAGNILRVRKVDPVLYDGCEFFIFAEISGIENIVQFEEWIERRDIKYLAVPQMLTGSTTTSENRFFFIRSTNKSNSAFETVRYLIDVAYGNRAINVFFMRTWNFDPAKWENLKRKR